MYKVSICTPIYGVEKYIERCARSLFEQTYPNIEYVFINDCTPDGSIEILKKLICYYPNRKDSIKIISHEYNKGLAAARNTAIANSTGDFVIHVDGDDSIDIHTVEKLVNHQIAHNSDIVCFDAIAKYVHHTKMFEKDDYDSPKDLLLKMLAGKAQHQVWGHFIRMDLYKKHKIAAIEGVNQAEDYQVMPRLVYYAQSVSTLHEALYFYDCTRESSFTNNFNISSLKQIDRAEEILSVFFADKEQCYITTIKKREASRIAERMKTASLFDDDSYYDNLLKCRDSLPHKYKGIDSLPYIIIMFLKHKSIIRLFVKSYRFLNKILYEIKN